MIITFSAYSVKIQTSDLEMKDFIVYYQYSDPSHSTYIKQC